MARHRSTPRAETNKRRKQELISKQLCRMIGDDKSLRHKGYDRLLGEAKHKFELIGALNKQADAGGESAVTARRKLREMRDVKYYVDAAPAAGELYQKQGKTIANPARGSTGRAKKLLSGHNARNAQAKGL